MQSASTSLPPALLPQGKSLGPLRFKPLLKRLIWGGRRLESRFQKPLGQGNDYAESWELVDRPQDQSVIAAGLFEGRTLGEMIASDPASMLGRFANYAAFPLLIKYLDCNRVLSVQVHPDDHYASQMPVPDLGKTEAWYVIEAEAESVIYAGLKSGVGREDLARAMRAGHTDEVLHSFHPEPHQFVFIPAGTVHALGAGIMVAEIQQSSDTTFRLFDWNRVGDDGQPRKLHVDQALEVTDYSRGPVMPKKYDHTAGWNELVDCDKFAIRRATEEDQSASQSLSITGDNEPLVLMLVEGRAELICDDHPPEMLTAGETVLLPASCCNSTVQWHDANSVVLEIRLR